MPYSVSIPHHSRRTVMLSAYGEPPGCAGPWWPGEESRAYVLATCPSANQGLPWCPGRFGRASIGGMDLEAIGRRRGAVTPAKARARGSPAASSRTSRAGTGAFQRVTAMRSHLRIPANRVKRAASARVLPRWCESVGQHPHVTFPLCTFLAQAVEDGRGQRRRDGAGAPRAEGPPMTASTPCAGLANTPDSLGGGARPPCRIR